MKIEDIDVVNHPALVRAALGSWLGSGQFRHVFELGPGHVVKIERNRDDLYQNDMTFHNVREWDFWNEHKGFKSRARWLAPCEWISSDGRVLVQTKTDKIPDSMLTKLLPRKIPFVLSRDPRTWNWGLLEGQTVYHDYGFVHGDSWHLVKPEWRWPAGM